MRMLTPLEEEGASKGVDIWLVTSQTQSDDTSFS